jgi:sarcosine oxidase subunit beta
VHLVAPGDLSAICPQLAVDDVAHASYEPESGYADPVATTRALAARAADLGATIVQHTAVEQIETTGGRVTGVRTTAGRISAPAVVVCAGLLADRLLAPLGVAVEIRPTRHQMCFFRRPAGFAGHPVIVDTPNGTYLRPDLGELTICGVGQYDEVVDPDAYHQGVDAGEIGRNAALIARRLPVMRDALSRGGYAGVYDVTPDRQPVLGAIPEYAGLYACFGWSGHGFKHAPVIGEVIADVVLEGASPEFDLAPFRWSRFREGDLLPPATPLAASPV